MQDYVYRIGVIYKGVKAIAGSILDAVLIAYSLFEDSIAVYLVSDPSDFIQEIFMGPGELQPRSGVEGIQHGAVAEYNLHSLDSIVTVLGCAAAHAAGVVGSDTADHTTVDRGWIRSYLPVVRREISVRHSADHSRFESNPLPVVVDCKILPPAGYNQEH